MPRQRRIDYPGALHHIMVRGIEKRNIFLTRRDGRDFLSRIGPILKECRSVCYAWTLMPNHFHLLLRTGTRPISTVMQRLLTGYAVSFNRRHDRRGKFFQNRYKSILCQENSYFQELIAYIHLNPLRAGQVDSMDELKSHEWTGHGVLLGQRKCGWQNTDTVLASFGPLRHGAREEYRRFVTARVRQGRRQDLAEGMLIRNLDGWQEIGHQKRTESIGSDERILGDSNFVEEVLRKSREAFSHSQDLKVRGFDFEKAAKRVAALSDLSTQDLFGNGKQRTLVSARRVLCYWAVRVLGMSATDVARRIGLSQPTVSIAVQKGEKIARDREWRIEG